MQHEHRGHIIRITEGRWLRAELIERATGALLPTAATATADEGRDVLEDRARRLVDIYLDSRRRLERPPPSCSPALRIV